MNKRSPKNWKDLQHLNSKTNSCYITNPNNASLLQGGKSFTFTISLALVWSEPINGSDLMTPETNQHVKKRQIELKNVAGFQPIWKICSSKWVHLPQGSGWKYKIFETTTGRERCGTSSFLFFCDRPLKKVTWQAGKSHLDWWIFHLKIYLLSKMLIFPACHVRFRGDNHYIIQRLRRSVGEANQPRATTSIHRVLLVWNLSRFFCKGDPHFLGRTTSKNLKPFQKKTHTLDPCYLPQFVFLKMCFDSKLSAF